VQRCSEERRCGSGVRLGGGAEVERKMLATARRAAQAWQRPLAAHGLRALATDAQAIKGKITQVIGAVSWG